MLEAGILTAGDRQAKVYAQASIPEYRVVDVKRQQLLVFCEPQEDTYRVEQVLGGSDRLSPVAFPDVVIELSSLLS